MKFVRSVAKIKRLRGILGRDQTPQMLAPIDERKIPDAFDFVDYVFCNPDLADKFRSYRHAAEHYLRHGIQEGRRLSSDTVDRVFVRKLYGETLRAGLDIPDAGRLLRKSVGLERFYPTLQHALRFNGLLNDDFLGQFDHDYYARTNKISAPAGLPLNRALCLVHFCEIGVNLGYPFSSERPFDADFYADGLAETAENPIGEPLWTETAGMPSVFPLRALAGRSPATKERSRLLRHWLNIGLPSGEAGNFRDWLRTACNLPAPEMNDLDLGRYRALNPDLADVPIGRELAAHFANVGIPEGRPGATPTIATAEMFVTKAEQMSGQGDLARAGFVYDLVRYRVPQYRPALHPTADNLLKQAHHGGAIRLYREALAAGVGGRWSYINLSSALDALKDREAANDVLLAAAAAYPEDMLMKKRVSDSTTWFFHQSLAQASLIAAAGDIRSAQGELTRICEKITPPEDARAARRAIRSVAIVANCDLYQCRVYRVDQKLEQFHEAGIKAEVFEQHRELGQFLDRMHEFDAVIFYRVPAFPPIIDAITRANAFGLATFYDIDDLIFDAAHYPDPIESYVGLVTPSEYAGLCMGVPLFAHAMRLCDYGIASTPALATEMKRYVRTGEVFLHRNGFGLAHQHMAEKRHARLASDSVTIFYGSGTKAHKEDFQTLVEPALLKLHARYGRRITIAIVGYNPLSSAASELSDIVTTLDPVWDIEAFWTLLRDADINVAVVKPTLVTSAKSEIKWMEAAMFAIPSVVSRTATYEGVVKDGVTGFLCDTSDDFFDALDRLVQDAELRNRVGTAAYRQVLQDYSVPTMAQNLKGIFAALDPARLPRTKLLIVNVFYPPQAFGGATRVVHANVKDLKARFGDAYDIEVFTSVEGSLQPYQVLSYAQDGLRVTGVTTPDDPDIDRKYSNPQMGKLFDEYLTRFEPDLIHFHCIQRLTIDVVRSARSRGIPYFVTVHDGWWISDRQFLTDEDGEIETYNYRAPRDTAFHLGSAAFQRQSALQLALGDAVAVLAVSEPFAEIYRKAGVPNVIAVANGVSDLKSGTRTRSSTGRVRLAHVGGTERHKGLYLIRLALLERPFANFELTVVDYAKRRGYIGTETWGQTPVWIVGPVPQSRVNELYENIDVHLACSTWPESYGLVTRESSAFGCWIVASDAGNVGEPVMEGLNGHIVKCGDVQDLIRVLEIIDRNPDLYLGPTRQQPVLRGSMEQTEDLVSLYREALAVHTNRPTEATTPDDAGTAGPVGAAPRGNPVAP